MRGWYDKYGRGVYLVQQSLGRREEEVEGSEKRDTVVVFPSARPQRCTCVRILIVLGHDSYPFGHVWYV